MSPQATAGQAKRTKNLGALRAGPLVTGTLCTQPRSFTANGIPGRRTRTHPSRQGCSSGWGAPWAPGALRNMGWQGTSAGSWGSQPAEGLGSAPLFAHAKQECKPPPTPTPTTKKKHTGCWKQEGAGTSRHRALKGTTEDQRKGLVLRVQDPARGAESRRQRWTQGRQDPAGAADSTQKHPELRSG